jgi:hypothetical protein
VSPNHTRLRHLLMAAYPPSFRARYGAELDSLVEDTPPSARVAGDLLINAARAWIRPVGIGNGPARRRWRLEATMSTAFVAWCSAVVAMSGFSRGVDDSALPGLGTEPTASFFRVAESGFATIALVMVVGLLFYACVVLLPAIRRNQRGVWLPIALPIVGAGAWGGLSVLLGFLVSHLTQPEAPTLALLIPVGILLLAWVALGGLCLLACAAGATLALRRAHLRQWLLIPGAIGGALLAAGLVLCAVTASMCVISLRGYNPVSDLIIPAGGVALLLTSALVATVSGVRGLMALRPVSAA